MAAYNESLRVADALEELAAAVRAGDWTAARPLAAEIA